MIAGIAFAVLFAAALLMVPTLPGIDKPGYDPQRPYYESWGAALESMVVDLELTTPAALDAAAPTERAPL